MTIDWTSSAVYLTIDSIDLRHVLTVHPGSSTEWGQSNYTDIFYRTVRYRMLQRCIAWLGSNSITCHAVLL